MVKEANHRIAKAESDPSWRAEAECIGVEPDLFYPNQTKGEVYEAQVEVAKDFCGRCVVRKVCLEAALLNREQGIWGGTTEEERRVMLSERRKKAS